MKELPVILVQLVHIQGPLMGQIQDFTEDTITIGRHSSCSVRFPTELTTISRTHAELVREGNRYKITDRSTNGTFVNGKRVTEAFLKDGDVIMFTEGGPKVSFLAKITDAVRTAPPPDPVSAVAPQGEPQAAPARPAAPVEQPAPPRAEPGPPPVPPVAKAPPRSPVQEPPVPPSPARQTVQKVQVPLIVQFGPAIRTYKELPIVIGKKADSDFVLSHPALSDHHAQIFFSQDMYWIKDLSGRNLITIDGRPIGYEAPLKAQDIISLTPTGPALRFLGEGRIAEYEEAPAEEAPSPKRPPAPEPARKAKPSRSIFDIFKK